MVLNLDWKTKPRSSRGVDLRNCAIHWIVIYPTSNQDQMDWLAFCFCLLFFLAYCFITHKPSPAPDRGPFGPNQKIFLYLAFEGPYIDQKKMAQQAWISEGLPGTNLTSIRWSFQDQSSWLWSQAFFSCSTLVDQYYHHSSVNVTTMALSIRRIIGEPVLIISQILQTYITTAIS